MSQMRTVGYWFYTNTPEEKPEKKQLDQQPEEKPLKPWQTAAVPPAEKPEKGATQPARKKTKKKQPAGPLRKDGTPDMRYKANW